MVEPHDAGFEASCPAIGNMRLGGSTVRCAGQSFRNGGEAQSSTVARCEAHDRPLHDRYGHENDGSRPTW